MQSGSAAMKAGPTAAIPATPAIPPATPPITEPFLTLCATVAPAGCSCSNSRKRASTAGSEQSTEMRPVWNPSAKSARTALSASSTEPKTPTRTGHSGRAALTADPTRRVRAAFPAGARHCFAAGGAAPILRAVRPDEALDGFLAYGRGIRNLSPHTLEAYGGDLARLCAYLDRAGAPDVRRVDVALLR